MTGAETPIHLWADAIEELVAECPYLRLERVVVLASTASTQDAAAMHAGTNQGLACIADRQTGGRGRLGRTWADDLGKGVSMTLALPDDADAAKLSLASGVAVAEACAAVGPGPRVGLRWPNDVVDRVSGAKIAGILIERRENLTLLGIGVNAHQSEDDWEQIGQASAVSLAELADNVDRLVIMTSILRTLDELLALESKAIAEKWLARDTLTGTTQTFEHDGRRVEGLVESIDPSNTLIVRTTRGLVRLPAQSTSLVHQA